MAKLITRRMVTLLFSALTIIIGHANSCFGDLTFHPATTTAKIESNRKNTFETEIYPSPNGIEFFVERAAVLQIAESNIISMTVRDAPRDPFLENAAKRAGERSGEKYTKRPFYEVVFELKSSEAIKMTDFAKRNVGKTFALRFRTLTLGMPTFLGAFPEGDSFALVGVSDGNIERIRNMVPRLYRDQRNKLGQ